MGVEGFTEDALKSFIDDATINNTRRKQIMLAYLQAHETRSLAGESGRDGQKPIGLKEDGKTPIGPEEKIDVMRLGSEDYATKKALKRVLGDADLDHFYNFKTSQWDALRDRFAREWNANHTSNNQADAGMVNAQDGITKLSRRELTGYTKISGISSDFDHTIELAAKELWMGKKKEAEKEEQWKIDQAAKTEALQKQVTDMQAQLKEMKDGQSTAGPQAAGALKAGVTKGAAEHTAVEAPYTPRTGSGVKTASAKH
jgi:hypothetical protein